jgi:uncharacterized membrane protein
VRINMVVVIEAVGAALIVGGISKWSPALACIVAGVVMIAYGETR